MSDSRLAQQAFSDTKILACTFVAIFDFSDPAGTTKEVRLLFTKGTAEPQDLQNDFEKSRSGCSYTAIESIPLNHVTFCG